MFDGPLDDFAGGADGAEEGVADAEVVVYYGELADLVGVLGGMDDANVCARGRRTMPM